MSLEDNVHVFNYGDVQVRVIDDAGGTRWFVARDVAKAVGVRDAYCVTRHLSEDDLAYSSDITDSDGLFCGGRDMRLVSLDGIKRFVSCNAKPDVLDFYSWLMRDALPLLERECSEGIFRNDDRLDASSLPDDAEFLKEVIRQKEILIHELERISDAQRAFIDLMTSNLKAANCVR